MNRTPVILKDTVSVEEVASHLGAKSVSAVLLVNKNQDLSGIFTEKDLARSLKHDTKFSRPIADVMSKNLYTVSATTDLHECAAKMLELNCKHLPVVEGKTILGIVEILDVQSAIAEELKSHVKQLESAHAKISQRDEYLSIVAHDIRSPLSVITICCEMIELLQNNQPLGYDESELITRIKYNTDRALNLVHDLLDIGRLKAGAQLNFEWVNVSEYLLPMVENLRFTAGEKEITLLAHLDKPISARVDRVRYGEIIINLIQNAIKFSPRKSQIDVSSEFRPGKSEEKNLLVVAVKDQGPGIPEDKMREIFGKYKQLDSESKYLGFGLGLSIANQFTRLHAGVIEVESKQGNGTVFRIVTPNAKSL